MANKTKLHLTYSDEYLGVKNDNIRAIFAYGKGLSSLVFEEEECLYRSVKPTFWRATTDNDRGSKFSYKSAVWYGADMFTNNTQVRVWVDEKENPALRAPANNQYTGKETCENLKICFTYETATSPKTTVDVTYQVTPDGVIKVDTLFHGKAGLPQLPVFGLRFILPTKASGYRYDGLSGETYPDRMAGGEKGVYQVDGLPVTPYLVPQDCRLHMQTNWVEITRNTTLSNVKKETKPFQLTFEKHKTAFAFQALPYTAHELESAYHHEELPPARRTVVTILGATRGVGGYDSWQADVDEKYHISAEQDISFSFLIKNKQEMSEKKNIANKKHKKT